MLAFKGVATALAVAARSRFPGAQQHLPEPERQSLLSDPFGTVQKDGRRQLSGAPLFGEAVGKGAVAVKWEERQAGGRW
jgi:hypothetical protein